MVFIKFRILCCVQCLHKVNLFLAVSPFNLEGCFYIYIPLIDGVVSLTLFTFYLILLRILSTGSNSCIRLVSRMQRIISWSWRIPLSRIQSLSNTWRSQYPLRRTGSRVGELNLLFNLKNYNEYMYCSVCMLYLVFDLHTHSNPFSWVSGIRHIELGETFRVYI